MNSTFKIALAFGLLACFVQTSFGQSTTVAPRPRYIHRVVNKNLEPLQRAAEEVRQSFLKIDRDFELAISDVSHYSKLPSILEHVKERESNGTGVLVDINFEIQDMDRNVFLDRLWVDITRIEVEAYLRVFRAISLEIVAFQQRAVSQFPRYAHSDSVSVVQLMIHDKMDKLMQSLRGTDDLIQDAYYHNGNSTVYTYTTKQSFVKHFAEIQANLVATRNEIAFEYYREVEAIRLGGQVVALAQQAQVELELDVFNYMAYFVKKYEELFFRLN